MSYDKFIRLLLTMVPDQRASVLREGSLDYRTNFEPGDCEPVNREELALLLRNAPLP